MRILHLISSSGQYGAENMLMELLSSLKRANCDTTLGVLENQHRPNTEMVNRAAERGLDVELIGCEGRFDRGTVRNIRNLIRRQGVDAVHAHGYKADFYGYWATRGAGVPILSTCHNWPGNTLALRVYYRIDRAILRRFDKVVGVSEQVVEVLHRSGVPADKTLLIDNGIDVDRFSAAGLPNGSRASSASVRIGAVGRLVPEKALQFLLRAARDIVKEFPATEFVLVGDGPERGSLESLAQELNIEKHVMFTGARKDMPEVYRSLDILAMPSLKEGMPLALLEGMASGKAVVASRVGAIPRLIADGRTGLLVEPGNESELRDALLRYLRNPDLARTCGQMAAEHVRAAFSAEAMGRNYLTLYRSLLRERTVPEAVLQQGA